MRRSRNFKKLMMLATLGLASIIGCSRKDEFAVTLSDGWLFKADSLEKGITDKWFRKELDRSSWKPVSIPEHLDLSSPPAPSGAGWYATTLDIKDPTKQYALFFGDIEDEVSLWLDGEDIGSTVCRGEPWICDIPASSKPGTKGLVVRLSHNGSVGELCKPVSLVPKDRVLEMFKTEYSTKRARPSEDWIRDGVIYEVYLRSFSHQGGFRALEKRLPELKELGVTVLWLMPIHPVGELNRKGTYGSPYSVQDYYAVNPEYGSLEDFRSLVRAVHGSGMKIILDLVAEHTAWDSKLVMEHPDWFVKNEEGAITSPNPEWSDVAKLNYGHHELRKYMIEMMKYWVRDAGIDGYRCDAARMIPTDFWEHARAELEKIKPVMMLSEGTLPEHHVESFDATYSWPFYDAMCKVTDGSTSAKVFDDIITAEGYRFPLGALRLRFNTNQDDSASDAPAALKFTRKGARTTAVLSFTFPGVPLIYNGEEVGNEKTLSLFEKVDIDWTKNIEFRAFYQVLSALRSSQPALTRGQYIPVSNTNGGRVLTFLRQLGDNRVLVALNLSGDHRSCDIAVPAFKTTELMEYFTRTPVSCVDGHLSIEFRGLDYKVFVPLSKPERIAQ